MSEVEAPKVVSFKFDLSKLKELLFSKGLDTKEVSAIMGTLVHLVGLNNNLELEKRIPIIALLNIFILGSSSVLFSQGKLNKEDVDFLANPSNWLLVEEDAVVEA